MSNKRNRWLTISVMAVGALFFIAFSIVLPFSGAFQQNQKSAGTSPSPQSSASPTDLETQAKGYELVLQREPENQTALRGLVETRIQQGKIEAVVEPLQKLANLNPDQPDYSVLLAQTKQRLGDREGAAELYRGILTKQPGSVNALKGLTDLLIQQQRPEAAIGLLQDTIKSADETNKAQPGAIDVSSVQLLLGQIYAQSQRYDEAIAIYDQVSQANKQDFRPLLGKAILLRAQGKNDAAQPLFASAAALAPAKFKDQINQIATRPSPTPSPAPSAGNSSGSPSPAPSNSPAAESNASPAPETSPAAPPSSN